MGKSFASADELMAALKDLPLVQDLFLAEGVTIFPDRSKPHVTCVIARLVYRTTSPAIVQLDQVCKRFNLNSKDRAGKPQVVAHIKAPVEVVKEVLASLQRTTSPPPILEDKVAYS